MYNCKYCNKEYKDKGNLRKHEKYEHEESAYTETCPYCNKKLMPGRVSFHVSRCRKILDVLQHHVNLDMRSKSDKS